MGAGGNCAEVELTAGGQSFIITKKLTLPNVYFE